ncbi:hypothetical protein [Candidatus Tisiphia endosymbiont of Micropterix aruncella]
MEEEINYWDNSQYESCQYATRLLDKLRKVTFIVNMTSSLDTNYNSWNIT